MNNPSKEWSFDRLADDVVRRLRSQPSTLAGEDSGLGNVWLEFAAQVQGEHSIDWHAFEAHVEETVDGVLHLVPTEALESLWARLSENAGSNEPTPPIDVGDIAQRIYGAVFQRAADCDDPRLRRFLTGDDDDFEDYSD